MTMQKQLYLHNRKKLQQPACQNETAMQFEAAWIQSKLDKYAMTTTSPLNLNELNRQFKGFVVDELATEPDSSKYVAGQMSAAEFKILVQEFAIDGLTEAQVFYYIMPRLPLEAQMPMLKILIDEFGSGNYKLTHSHIYIDLLKELSMSTDDQFYFDLTGDASFEFLNVFHWLTLRADCPSYFAGALTYLETVIPTVFGCYVDACERLDIKASRYYSEHIHIDEFHAKEGLALLRTMSRTQCLDVTKAWHGILLASEITNGAFEAAVTKARQSTLSHHEPTLEVKEVA